MRGVRHRLTRSAGGASSSIFQPTFFLPLQDAGAGAVNTTLAKGLGSATFTRATTAWAKLSTGLWASVASGTARSCYLGTDTTVGAYGGYLAEGARTNLCLQSRDMSNASWTKTTMTAAKDQVGIDGAANSASSLTATAGAATCLQTITEAATLSALSLFIKRITGTGAVTIQQGASTLAVTGLINSSTYTRVELDATVLNPAIGIILATNGDKIAVDMVQFENGAFATSPIPTTTISVARNEDLLNYPGAGNIVGTVGTAYAEVIVAQQPFSAGAPQIVSCFDGINFGVPIGIADASGNLGIFDGTAWRASTTPIAANTAAPQKVATTWNGLSGKAYLNGVGTATAALDGDLSPVGKIAIGSQITTGAVQHINGTIKNVRIWTRALTDIQIAGL